MTKIEELKQDSAVDAILWIGNPGCYGTYGIAPLLSGAALPSGHLPDTFAVNSALSPAAQNYGIYVFENADDIETTNNNALRSSWYVAELEGIVAPVAGEVHVFVQRALHLQSLFDVQIVELAVPDHDDPAG